MSESSTQTDSEDSNDTLTQLYKETWQAFTPTKEEREMNLPVEDLIKLCKKDECTVDLTRWNPLYDFYRYYRKKGKLDGKKQQKINKLLLKTVNRYKDNPKYTYSQDDIKNVRYAEWKTRKLWNILWLQNNRFDSDGNKSTDRSTECSLDTVIESAPQMADDGDNDIIIPDSDNSLQHLYSEAEVCFNTETLTENILESNTETQSQDIIFTQGSEGYKEFHMTIPLTSTQSQDTDG